MTFAIRVRATSQTQNVIFEENFANYAAFQTVSNLCANRMTMNIGALLFAVRTNTSQNLYEDLFFPASMCTAIRTNGLVEKILSTSILIFLDVCTLPLRLTTLLPRYVYNKLYPKHAHPFYKFLLAHGVNQNVLNADHIYLERKWIAADGTGRIKGETFNFIQLPHHASPIARSDVSSGNPYIEFDPIN